MRVAYIDMRNSSHQCPSGFRTLTRSSNPRRVCDTTGTNISYCPNTSFSVHGLSYRHVYGQIIAYQNGYAIAFHSIGRLDLKCPCINRHISTSNICIPSFIGNAYFCDTSLSSYYGSYSSGLYPNDPLWDGKGCGTSNTCCSVSNLCTKVHRGL
jgi:hypothetical protein